MKSKYCHAEGRRRRIKNPFKVSEKGDDGKWSLCVQLAFFDGWHQTLQERLDWLFGTIPEFENLHETKKAAQIFVDLAWEKYIEGMVQHGLADTLP